MSLVKARNENADKIIVERKKATLDDTINNILQASNAQNEGFISTLKTNEINSSIDEEAKETEKATEEKEDILNSYINEIKEKNVQNDDYVENTSPDEEISDVEEKEFDEEDFFNSIDDM